MAIMAAMIDSREPSSIQALKFGNVPTVVTTLDCGDLWVSCDDGSLLIIERKTPSDLLGSIKDGRLFVQAAAMRERSPWAYLMVTGALAHTLDGHVVADGRATGWRWDDVQGALLTVQEMGVSLIACQSDAHYEESVIKMARRERAAEKVLEPRTVARVLTPAEQVLCALPGIGLERAQTLMGRFETAAYALAWLTWLGSVEEVAGIGDGTKHNVRRALGLDTQNWLTVFSPEAAKYAATEATNGGGNGVEAVEMVGVLAQNGTPIPA